jgi:hypothetical protein
MTTYIIIIVVIIIIIIIIMIIIVIIIITAGSRTPHYGSMTPSHDGSRTPGQSGAWDPSITNTPARNNDFDGYSLDEASPSPNYNPSKLFFLFSQYFCILPTFVIVQHH